MSHSTPSIQSLSNEEVLYHLLKKEHGYYKAILNLTHNEHEKLITNQNPNQIHPILKKKKVLLSCIRDIEAAIGPLKNFWENKSDRSAFSSIKISDELSALNLLLKEILQLDLVNQKLLKNQLNMLQAKMDLDSSNTPLVRSKA